MYEGRARPAWLSRTKYWLDTPSSPAASSSARGHAEAPRPRHRPRRSPRRVAVVAPAAAAESPPTRLDLAHPLDEGPHRALRICTPPAPLPFNGTVSRRVRVCHVA